MEALRSSAERKVSPYTYTHARSIRAREINEHPRLSPRFGFPIPPPASRLVRARANHSGRGSTPRAITNSRPLSAEIDGDGREKFFSFRISRVGKFAEGRGGEGEREEGKGGRGGIRNSEMKFRGRCKYVIRWMHRMDDGMRVWVGWDLWLGFWRVVRF